MFGWRVSKEEDGTLVLWADCYPPGEDVLQLLLETDLTTITIKTCPCVGCNPPLGMSVHAVRGVACGAHVRGNACWTSGTRSGCTVWSRTCLPSV